MLLPIEKKNSNRLNLDKSTILKDYQLAFISREASIAGRKDVLSGRAKFGIFGDGKELAQIAMAKSFQGGDWRSGYYRDQTFMFATGASTVRQFFAQLYADTDPIREPASAGRQMNSHYATHLLDSQGEWLSQTDRFNSSADASPTACQMARLVGLGYASKLYRENGQLHHFDKFSHHGNEIAFGTIGNASTSEGIFWESVNAICVLGLPVIISVWDDDYGISVHNRHQTTKESISAACAGFQRNKEGGNGLDIYVVKGWDYEELIETYQTAAENARKNHIPALIHVTEITQPQGHSTSGSHERYKSKKRLEYEKNQDALRVMKQWIIEQNIATPDELESVEDEAKKFVKSEKKNAWEDYLEPIIKERNDLIKILKSIAIHDEDKPIIEALIEKLKQTHSVHRRLIHQSAREACYQLNHYPQDSIRDLVVYVETFHRSNSIRYNSKLFVESPTHSPLSTKGNTPIISDDSQEIDGRLIIRDFFDHKLESDSRIFIIGEDIGQLGGVNLEFDGLHEKYGEIRVSDTGIREATILGQGIGAALRGLRPIVDIQYLDYLLYAFQVMSDDLASLHYRTAGSQVAPVIIRTKGHRLEGIWHSGSPLGTIIHGSRGMHVCVPRNMLQAAGMYNTLLKGNDPALVVEVLNAYRLKEKKPLNLDDYFVELGVPELLREGSDITVVSYGACLNIIKAAMPILEKHAIDIELIDVQTLLPFDRNAMIAESLKKTNAILFVDEDVPGGASSFMMQQVLEEQKGYDYLDAPPKTLTAQAHRSPYGSDGDYFTKPNTNDVFETIYSIMHERNPQRYPALKFSLHN